MQHHAPNLFENIPAETLRLKKYIYIYIYIYSCWKQSSYCRKEIVLPFLQLEQNVFCITITDLRSPALKVDEINNFSTHTHRMKTDTAGSK
jgi:hypothetical protein